MVSAHGMDNATMPIGAPECWIEGDANARCAEGLTFINSCSSCSQCRTGRQPLDNENSTYRLVNPVVSVYPLEIGQSHTPCPSSFATVQSIGDSCRIGLALHHRRIPEQFLSACLEFVDAHPLLSCGQRPCRRCPQGDHSAPFQQSLIGK